MLNHKKGFKKIDTENQTGAELANILLIRTYSKYKKQSIKAKLKLSCDQTNIDKICQTNN